MHRIRMRLGRYHTDTDTDDIERSVRDYAKALSRRIPVTVWCHDIKVTHLKKQEGVK